MAVILPCLVLAALREPLAQWLWPETRIQQLLGEAEAALRAGRLDVADGSGARQKFEAAQALDGDRREAVDGLARTGQAALAQARAALRDSRFDAARAALALARELQVPGRESDALAAQLRTRQSGQIGLDDLLRQAGAARGRGDFENALPLYQHVLALQPDRIEALEGREDMLSDLLQRARDALGRGDLAGASSDVAKARAFDAGHVDLPATEAAFARAVEARVRQADRALARRRPKVAEDGYRAVQQVLPDNVGAQQGLERLGAAFAEQAARDARDFRFDEAEAALRHARGLAPRSAAIGEAERGLGRARAAWAGMHAGLTPAQRRRQVRDLLAQAVQAQAEGRWLTPPGDSAYDKLRAAQALAPGDGAVKQALAQLVPQAQACFEDELRSNRVRAAQPCFDAWQALDPATADMRSARRRLAQRWVAIGDERLRAGDVAFARNAVRRAESLDPQVPELAPFAARVRSLAPTGP